MLQHVGIEVRPADLERAVEFWRLLGFEQVEPPRSLAGSFTWLEHDGAQIHLMHEESPTVPPRAHVAVAPRDFDDACDRLAVAGFEIERRREHWGAPRAVAIAPGGHRVELMATPPRSSAAPMTP